MITSAQYLEYAQECMTWARASRNDLYREALLQLAATYMAAAIKAQNPPVYVEQSSPSDRLSLAGP